MEDVARAALAAASVSGVVYADVRVGGPNRSARFEVRNGVPTGLTSAAEAGVGIRVRTPFAWGFSATTGLGRSDVRSAAERAVRVARAAGSRSKKPLDVADYRPSTRGTYRSPVQVDPFRVDPSETIALLKDAEKATRTAKSVRTGRAIYTAWKERTEFASTDGGEFVQEIVHVGAGVEATAVRGHHVERRSRPNSFGGDFRQAGMEFIRGLDLIAQGGTASREAAELLEAPACPTGTTTLVLASDQLALQVHESVGHATELDRVLGWEAGFAGTSWVSAGDAGRLIYGSEAMNVVADAVEAGGLGSYGWDDDGVEAQRTPLIDSGRLVGFQTSRETAALIGAARSSGSARADGFARAPLVRMTNIDLSAGDYEFSELLEGVRDGVFLSTNRSWSIDDKRLNFQFGTEVGYTIEDGELGALVRQPIYAGMTPQFWASMDAVGDVSTWHLWGLPNCGKGQPGQLARVSHGAPAARFRHVRVRGGT